MVYNFHERAKDFTEHRDKYVCIEHKDREIRKRIIKGGRIQYVEQCLRCGKAVSNPIKKSKIQVDFSDIEPPEFDEELKENWEKEEEDGYNKIYQEHENKDAFRKATFLKWYSEYLCSEEWINKREKVFQRANGVCEGCLEQKASEVHHVSYRNVGHEFLFELVALCSDCHMRFHESYSQKDNAHEAIQKENYR